MAMHDRRRGTAKRRDGVRGPAILRFEPLECRQLLSTTTATATVGGPDLAAVATSADAYSDWGGPIHVSGTVQNIGNADATGDFKVDVYVSSTPTPDAGAVKIGTVDVPDGLKAGAQASFSQDFDLPPTAVSGVGADGAIYIGLVADSQGNIAETNEANNYGQRLGQDSALVLIRPQAPASLAATAITLDQPSATWGQQVGLTVTIQNTQTGTAPATKARIVLSPSDAAPGTNRDVTLVGDIDVPSLLPNQSSQVHATVTLPPGPPTGFTDAGSYVLRVEPDADHLVNPTVTAPSVTARGVDYEVLSIAPAAGAPAVSTTKPDLSASNVLTPGATLHWGDTFQVAATVTNSGKVDAAGPIRASFVLAGPNGELQNALYLGDVDLPGGLKAGATTTITQTLKLPGRLPFDLQPGDGLGRIVVQVDSLNTVAETDETNNSAASGQMTLSLPTPVAPDLGVASGSTTSPTTGGSTTGGTTTGTNQPTTPTTPTHTPTQILLYQQRIAARRAQMEAIRLAMQQQRLAQQQARLSLVGRSILPLRRRGS